VFVDYRIRISPRQPAFHFFGRLRVRIRESNYLRTSDDTTFEVPSIRTRPLTLLEAGPKQNVIPGRYQ
jgi:hypothetical protein